MRIIDRLPKTIGGPLVCYLALGLTLVATLSCQSDPEPNKGVTPRESFQKIIGDLMAKWSIPGGAVALTKNEKLVMAEGYGLADKSTAGLRIGRRSAPI